MKILSVTLFLAFAVSVCLAAAGPKWSKMTKQPEEMGAHEEDKPMQIYKPDEKPEMRSGQTGFDAREGMKEVVAGRELPACVMENTDFPGNDISHGRSYQQSWQDCDEHCQHNPVCKYWTWGGSFYCFLKSSDKNKVDMNGLISGSKGCSAGAPSTIYIAPPTTTAPPTITCTPWYGRFHTGQDYYKIIENIATWEGCGTICKDDAKCKSWAWNVPDNSCFVTCKRCLLYKNSITLTDTSPNKDWISGPESCHTSLDCNYIGIG